jgi:hypothetical protein
MDMSKDKKFISENLNEEQERTLIVLLNLFIPPSEDGKMPSAADVGFLAYIHNENILPWIKEGLINIIEESHNKYGQEIFALSGSEQKELIDKLRRKFLQFFNRLTTHVIQCYYQHDDVLEAIGLEARPPFPQGYLLEEGDLTLLEPVYLRGKIYRN